MKDLRDKLQTGLICITKGHDYDKNSIREINKIKRKYAITDDKFKITCKRCSTEFSKTLEEIEEIKNAETHS